MKCVYIYVCVFPSCTIVICLLPKNMMGIKGDYENENVDDHDVDGVMCVYFVNLLLNLYKFD